MNIAIPSISSGAALGSLNSGSPIAHDSPDGGFGGLLSNAMSQVSSLNTGAEQQIGNLLTGRSADVSSVMVSVEKADVAFQLAMQVRNKIVGAYQDIEKMQF